MFPEQMKDGLGHVRMTDNIVRGTDQFILFVTGNFGKIIVNIDDFSFRIGLADDVFMGIQLDFILGREGAHNGHESTPVIDSGDVTNVLF